MKIKNFLIHFDCCKKPVSHCDIISEDEVDRSEAVCSGCLNIFDDEEVISALGQEWHMECFRFVKF